MRVALHRAGFVNPSFSRTTGPAGEAFVVEATKLVPTFAAARDVEQPTPD